MICEHCYGEGMKEYTFMEGETATTLCQECHGLGHELSTPEEATYLRCVAALELVDRALADLADSDGVDHRGLADARQQVEDVITTLAGLAEAAERGAA